MARYGSGNSPDHKRETAPAKAGRKYPVGKLMKKGTRLKCHGCDAKGEVLPGKSCRGCEGKGYIIV
jgi:DnaJ-class molecular chaperone